MGSFIVTHMFSMQDSSFAVSQSEVWVQPQYFGAGLTQSVPFHHFFVPSISCSSHSNVTTTSVGNGLSVESQQFPS